MKRIFFVDDSCGVRQVVDKTLSRAGFQVSCFASARECYLELVRRPCDLLITDVEMPGASGMVLLRAVRRRLPSLPVVVMSAEGYPETVMQAIRAGARDFLEKPVSRERLVAAAETALSTRPQSEEVGDGRTAGGACHTDTAALCVFPHL